MRFAPLSLTALALTSMVFAVAACGSNETKPAAPKKAEETRKAEDVPKEPAKAEPAKAEPFVAKPNVAPPPAPPGAIAVPNPWRYVQVCDETYPCPDLLQTEGELHCRGFKLGSLHDGWRLPSMSEMGEWAKTKELNQLEGYHWTRTPYEEDPMQAYIVDPSGKAQATTIPRKRKPFRIRCVYEP